MDIGDIIALVFIGCLVLLIIRGIIAGIWEK
jgi:hypothetical protein